MTLKDERDFEANIKRLLADPDYRDHPLYDALLQLWQLHREQVTRLERIANLSDAYQAVAREREGNLSTRFDKQLRQLTKIVRISDRYQQMMQDLNMALKEASTHDPLTGLANRRLLMERLKEETERASRTDTTFVVAMLDVDYFKRINDVYGHEAGDQVLSRIAHTIKHALREYDLCGRWGGEEFLLVLPQTLLPDAMTVIARVHGNIAELRFGDATDTLQVTCSIGVTEHIAGQDYPATLNRADAALLDAKRSGRNRFLGV